MAKTWKDFIDGKYDDLRKERDYWKLQLEESRELIAFYEKRIAGLKGYINTLKEKAK